MPNTVITNGDHSPKLINLNLPTSQAIVEEEKDEPKSPYATNIPKFELVYFPQPVCKILYEYKILEEKVRFWPVDSPWAFPSSFAYV